MSYDANGVAQNENQPIKIIHNSLEWSLFIKNMRANGYCKVEIDNIFDIMDDGSLIEVKDTSIIDNELQHAFTPAEVRLQTPEQERIAELERKLEKLTGEPKKAKKAKKIKNAPVAEVLKGDDRKALQAKYKEVFGKNPFNGWDNDNLKAKIDAEINS